MFSTVDASSTSDFSRVPIDEGVVDSTPSKDIGQTIVCSSLPLKSSRRNRICRSSSERYIGSAQPQQLYGPVHVGSAFKMTNAGESSPCFGQGGSEVQLQALCTIDSIVMGMSQEQIVEKMGATSKPNQSRQRILQRKKYSEGAASIQRRGGSSTSDSHFKLVRQMKYASTHPFLQLGKCYLQGRPANHYS
jgi:hypothetical protein